MALFRRNKPVPEPVEKPRAQLLDNSPSQVLNVLGRGLNAVLPQEKIVELQARVVGNEPITQDREQTRAFVALDWFVRTWVPRWSALVSGPGEELASVLAGLAPLRDLESAEAAGKLVTVLSDAPNQTAKTLESDYDEDNFFDMTAASAARKASEKAVTNSVGPAVADGAATVILDACLAARTDVALSAVSALSLLHSLDGVWPYIRQWADGPGDIDAKKMSITALAPRAAEKVLEPIVKPLQRGACQLYVELSRLG